MTPPPEGLTVLPVHGIGEVAPGTDLATQIGDAAPWLRDGDVLVVTSKIVAKAEGRLTAVPPDGPAREKAHADAVAEETARVVAQRGATRIVATRHGFVMASAGVDASNVDPGQLVLLPRDPDASARALRADLAARCGLRVAVVVSDTMGRPWRHGLTDVALGAAGLHPIRDHRGETDPYGNPLALTEHAVADELAAAAELVKGKTDQVPVAVVRGGDQTGTGHRPPVVTGDDGPGVVTTLVRESAHDLFSRGTAEARADGLRTATSAGSGDGAHREGAVDPAAVRRALAMADPVLAPHTRCTLTDPTVVRCTRVPDDDATAGTGPMPPAAWVRFGMDVQRLCAALAAEGVACTVQDPDPDDAYVSVRLWLWPTGQSG